MGKLSNGSGIIGSSSALMNTIGTETLSKYNEQLLCLYSSSSVSWPVIFLENTSFIAHCNQRFINQQVYLVYASSNSGRVAADKIVRSHS